jgi:hypothetical protein
MLSLKQEFGKSHGHRPHPPSVDKRNPSKCENIKTFGRRCRTMPRRGLIDHITIAVMLSRARSESLNRAAD